MQFEEGQKVKIIGNRTEHEFDIGQIVEITCIDRGDNIHECESDDGAQWWVHEDDMQHVESLAGCLARIICDDSGHGFEDGEIVKVLRYDEESEVWICIHSDGRDWWGVGNQDLEKVD